jgi:hypothetical protein
MIQELVDKESIRSVKQIDYVGHELIMTLLHILEICIIYISAINNCYFCRQYLDFRGLYDRDKLFWRDIEDVTITAACASRGGGINHLTSRFVRHFGVLFIPSPNEMTLKHIFKVCIVQNV